MDVNEKIYLNILASDLSLILSFDRRCRFETIRHEVKRNR